MPPCIVVTGGLRVGSRVLAEDLDHPSIVRLSPAVVVSHASEVVAHGAEVVAEPADVHARLTGFVADGAYQQSRTACQLLTVHTSTLTLHTFTVT